MSGEHRNWVPTLQKGTHATAEVAAAHERFPVYLQDLGNMCVYCQFGLNFRAAPNWATSPTNQGTN